MKFYPSTRSINTVKERSKFSDIHLLFPVIVFFFCHFGLPLKEEYEMMNLETRRKRKVYYKRNYIELSLLVRKHFVS